MTINGYELPDGKDMFNQKDIAKIIGRTDANVSYLVKIGKLPEFDKRIGNGLYYHRETVVTFLESYEAYASNPSRFKGSKNGKRSSKKAYKQMSILEEINNNG